MADLPSWRGFPDDNSGWRFWADDWMHKVRSGVQTLRTDVDSNDVEILALQTPVLSTALTLPAGWAHQGSPYGDGRATKTEDGRVQLEGVIRNNGATVGTATSPITLTTLPVGFRPADQVVCMFMYFNSTLSREYWGRMDITTGGQVDIRGLNGFAARVYLEGVSFRAA